MNKKENPLRRISAHANWDVPDHTEMFDLNFDPYPSLRNAFIPAWGDPLVFAFSLIQILSYGYFAFTIATLESHFCQNVTRGLLSVAPAALAVQLTWAIKAVFLLDKASDKPASFLSFLWRVVRTSLLTLPFSYMPSWIIGCLAWPVLRIDVHGGSNFYDQSVMIGQYVQNSLWYIGGRNGSLKRNFREYGDLTILHRSRYWDAAGEQSIFNILGFIVIFLVSYAVYYFLGNNASIVLFGKYALTGFHVFIFSVFFACGMVMIVVNTTGIAAISILEYTRIEDTAVAEPDLPPDRKARWMLYIPHALAGMALYGIMVFLFLPLPGTLLCK